MTPSPGIGLEATQLAGNAGAVTPSKFSVQVPGVGVAAGVGVGVPPGVGDAVGIGVGVPGPYYGDCGYYGCRRYYDYYNGPVVRFGTEPHYWHHYRHWD